MMKYEMKEMWNWKEVEIILQKEQRDKGRKEISVKKGDKREKKKERSGRVRHDKT